MISNWDRSFRKVLEHEGGFVNDPNDPGGMTNLGVTKAAWEEYLGRKVSEAEMRALTPDKIKSFYKTHYWDKVNGDNLPSGMDFAVFDFAINSGHSRAAKMLQSLLGVSIDGAIGPKTIAALKSRNIKEFISIYCNARLNYLKSLSTWKFYKTGWTRRVTETTFYSLWLHDTFR